jgi:hypothetical protein
MNSFGLSARLRFDLGSSWMLFFRLGLGYPIFFENGQWRGGSNMFWGMWPDLTLGVLVNLFPPASGAGL